MSSSFRLVYWIGLDLIGPSSRVLQVPLYLRTLWCYVSVLYLVEDLVWWDWPFTWWTDQLLSFSALTLLVGSSDP